MKYIAIEIATGKQVPVLDVTFKGTYEHYEPMTLKAVAYEVARRNREAGGKIYRVEAL